MRFKVSALLILIALVFFTISPVVSGIIDACKRECKACLGAESPSVSIKIKDSSAIHETPCKQCQPAHAGFYNSSDEKFKELLIVSCIEHPPKV